MNNKTRFSELEGEVQNILTPLGYDLIAIEMSQGGGKKIVLYIDFLNNEDETRKVSLEDCLTVNRAVDELFESTDAIDGHFTLEVSSPGMERPLRKISDYCRFIGKKARVHTFRPLETEEISNAAYLSTHTRQKNFVGVLDGIDDLKTKIKLDCEGQKITIPVELISKANLEIDFNQFKL